MSGGCLEGEWKVHEKWTQIILDKYFENGVIIKIYKSQVDPILVGGEGKIGIARAIFRVPSNFLFTFH